MVQTRVVVSGLRLPRVMTPTDDPVTALGCCRVGGFPGVMATGGVETTGRFLAVLMTGRVGGGGRWVRVGGCGGGGGGC